MGGLLGNYRETRTCGRQRRQRLVALDLEHAEAAPARHAGRRQPCQLALFAMERARACVGAWGCGRNKVHGGSQRPAP